MAQNQGQGRWWRRVMFTIIKAAAQQINNIVIGFSGGKDSIVLLDLCCRYFPRVEAFFMYLVPDLEFQEQNLRYYEKRYDIKILRIPHWQLSNMLKGTFRPPNSQTWSLPKIKPDDVNDYVREKTGIDWIGYGLKKSDSLSRRPWLEKNKGINQKKRIIYPLADFTDKAIYGYLKKYKLPLPIDYQLFGRSFGRLWAEELMAIYSAVVG